MIADLRPRHGAARRRRRRHDRAAGGRRGDDRRAHARARGGAGRGARRSDGTAEAAPAAAGATRRGRRSRSTRSRSAASQDVSFALRGRRDPRRRRTRGPGAGRALRRARRRSARRTAARSACGQAAEGPPPVRRDPRRASCSSRPTGCRRCCRSARCARTSPRRATTGSPAGGRSTCREERPARARRRSRRCRSTRAPQRQVRRLSGGNQQKVTIARWLASGFETMLCFDPTRGIDVGTKRQIYALLREPRRRGRGDPVLLERARRVPARLRPRDRRSTAAGSPPSCRAPAADEATLLHAMHGLVEEAGRVSAATADATSGAAARHPPPRCAGTAGRSASTCCSASCSSLYWRSATTVPGARSTCSRSRSTRCRSRSRRWAQAIVIISGGIDLSIGSMMSLDQRASRRKYMVHDASFRRRRCARRARARAASRRRPRRRAHRADHRRHARRGHHRHARDAVRVGGRRARGARACPGGGVPLRYRNLVTLDTVFTKWLPTALVILVAVVRGRLAADPAARGPGSRSTRSARTATPPT